jgi:catechol 2,3-dioxygenase-like lactoylglutathione lyase family enzyme
MTHTLIHSAIAIVVFVSASFGPVTAVAPETFYERTVSHIGMVVRDVDKTARVVADVFDLEMPPIRETQPVPFAAGYSGDQQAYTRVADMRFNNIVLEITQPVGGVSPWRAHLEQYGEGIHHLGFAVTNVEDTVRLLESKGGTRTLGSEHGDYALVDLMSYLGIVIELTSAEGDLMSGGPMSVGPPDPHGLKAIGRIGLIVGNVDQLCENWMTLFDVPVNPTIERSGLQFPDDYAGDPNASIRDAYVPLNNIWVNMMQPIGGRSPWRDLMNRREGAHYINFFVDDANETDAYLTSKGGRRILGNSSASYSYNDMHEVMGGLTVLLHGEPPADPRSQR